MTKKIPSYISKLPKSPVTITGMGHPSSTWRGSWFKYYIYVASNIYFSILLWFAVSFLMLGYLYAFLNYIIFSNAHTKLLWWDIKRLIKNILYIRNLKYAHLTPIFRQHNIHLVSSTCQHKYKWILWTENPVLNASFQDFWYTIINNHLFCFEKNDIYAFKD